MNHAEFVEHLREDPSYREAERRLHWRLALENAAVRLRVTLTSKIRYIYCSTLASLSKLALGILNVLYHLTHKPEPLPQPPRWMWAESTPTDLPHVWFTCYACPKCGGVVTSGVEHVCPGGAD